MHLKPGNLACHCRACTTARQLACNAQSDAARFDKWMAKVDAIADAEGFTPRSEPRDLSSWRKHHDAGLTPEQAWKAEPVGTRPGM